MTDQMDRDRLLELTAQIVSSHVGGNTVEPDALPSLITQVFQTLCSIGTGEVEAVKAEPAVPIKRSVFGAHLVCLECGKSFKMLKRHLSTDHSLTPEGYRTKWGLPTSYPLVAPNYAKIRSALAVSIGLGRTRQGVAGSPPPAVQVTKLPEARRGRRKMA